jgi:3-hydroxyacyl-[acyl-carrier-protein] dehydratase
MSTCGLACTWSTKIQAMLLNKLYRINSLDRNADGSGFQAEIELDPGNPVFGGHFPGNPILPGVCTVQIIRELLEQGIQKSLRMTKAGNIKYLGFVNPVTMPVLTFQLQVKIPESSDILCTATVSANGQVVCSFKGEFQSVADTIL